jgi:hypothetical protein
MNCVLAVVVPSVDYSHKPTSRYYSCLDKCIGDFAADDPTGLRGRFLTRRFHENSVGEGARRRSTIELQSYLWISIAFHRNCRVSSC